MGEGEGEKEEDGGREEEGRKEEERWMFLNGVYGRRKDKTSSTISCLKCFALGIDFFFFPSSVLFFGRFLNRHLEAPYSISPSPSLLNGNFLNVLL